MDLSRPLTVIVAMVAAGGAMGCADLVGADFDNVHPRSPIGAPDAASGTDGAKTDASEGKISNPAGDADAGSDGRWIIDVAVPPPDVHTADATDIVTRFDARDAIDPSHSDGARDVGYDDRHTNDTTGPPIQSTRDPRRKTALRRTRVIPVRASMPRMAAIWSMPPRNRLPMVRARPGSSEAL